MSFPMSFHLPLLGHAVAHWLDDPLDLSCKDSTGQHSADGSLLSCKQQIGGSSPRSSGKAQVSLIAVRT
jgi:hypothetical protein